MNKPTFHNVQQGVPEWHALRAKHYTASEAPAMIGVSPHKSRGQLLRERATAGESEIFQPVAEAGHAAEAGALEIAERLVDGVLYPVVATRDVDGLPLLASMDGLTIDGQVCWEHKLYRSECAAEVGSGSVPEEYQPQLEQQLLITGAQKALFMMSDGTAENCVSCWYEPNPELCTAIVAGWKQFAEDLDNYQHVETVPEPAGATPDALPSLLLDITGDVRSTNLATYQDVVSARIQAINTDLQTDQDFADAENMVKFLKSGEQEVEAAKAHALAQTQSVDELFRAVDSLKEEMRAKRLELDKLVKARKETIRAEIVAGAMDQMTQHAIEIAEGFDSRIRALDVPTTFRGEVLAAMKGKKTMTSLRDAAAQVVATWKLEMNAEADHIRANVRKFDELMGEHNLHELFPDLSGLVRKPADDFVATFKARIADHQEREFQREEAARERIRQEEAERLRAEQETDAHDSAAATHASDSEQSTTKVHRPPANEKPSVPLGDIGNRLGFAVREDFLASLGFPATRVKQSRLYRESDWTRICDAIVAHVQKVRNQSADKAA